MGRPTGYSVNIAEKICTRLAAGESLRKICKDEDLPSTSMVMRWVRQIPEFGEQYARARDEQAELLADELIEIADEAGVDSAGVQRNKLRVDTRKWVLAKQLPKKYGDNSSLSVSGPDGGTIPMSLEINL